jgi:hypothetical protein
MAMSWIGDDNDVVGKIDAYRLQRWRGDDDRNWAIGIDDGPVARGFADTLADAKDAAIRALDDYRAGQLQ